MVYSGRNQLASFAAIGRSIPKCITEHLRHVHVGYQVFNIRFGTVESCGFRQVEKLCRSLQK